MSPRGREQGWQGEIGTVNNKIYYPSVRPREGADRDCCSLELDVRYWEADFWGIHKRMEDWRFSAVACQWPQLEG